MTSDTPFKKTPLHDWHAANGGRMVDFAGWAMPVQYTSIVEEHRAVRNGVGLFDISHMGRLWIAGADAETFLDKMLTRRVAGMKPGRIRYSIVCNARGGILDDVLVYTNDGADSIDWTHQLVVNASNRETIIAHLEKQVGASEVSIFDTTIDTAMIAVQGPRAIEIVEPLLDVSLSEMRYYTGRHARFDGLRCFVSRTGYTGEDGCEFIIAADHATAVWEKLLESGRADGAAPIGLGARDTLRLEAAMPLYGHELSEAINPVQAGLGFAYNLKDREFTGRDAIAAFECDDSLPVRIGIELDGKRVAREGAELFVGGRRVGEVTSGTFSPTLEKPIAMAYVDRAASEPATQLNVDIRGKKHAARVIALPFYKRPE